jgi:hypothetical protein
VDDDDAFLQEVAFDWLCLHRGRGVYGNAHTHTRTHTQHTHTQHTHIQYIPRRRAARTLT